MTPEMAYVLMGACLYEFCGLIVGMLTLALWVRWARRKVGMFWDYSIGQGMNRYYPGIWDFVQHHHKIYSVVCCLLWPVALPVQMRLMTKVLNRLSDCRYY